MKFKTTLTLIILLLSTGLAVETNLSREIFVQSRNFSELPKEVLDHFDKMGVDNSPLLNSFESAYFNTIFEKSRKDFDFTDKKIGFLDRVSKINKAYFFKAEKARFISNITTSQCVLYIFDASQKTESGGYDAAIVSWSIFKLPIKDVITILKKKGIKREKK